MKRRDLTGGLCYLLLDGLDWMGHGCLILEIPHAQAQGVVWLHKEGQ